MFRYQVLIEYIGTNFVGWQIQSKGKSIQKEIQTKLSKLLKEKVVLIGSGRTDTGVHAWTPVSVLPDPIKTTFSFKSFDNLVCISF